MRWWVIGSVLVAAGCYGSDRGPHDGRGDDLSDGDEGRGEASEGAVDGVPDDLDMQVVGRTWTDPVQVDADLICGDIARCEGVSLMIGGGSGGTDCRANRHVDFYFIVVNCGSVATPVATTMSLYLGRDPAWMTDPLAEGAPLFTEGLIPAGLAADDAVEVHWAFQGEDWPIFNDGEGLWYVFDPRDRLDACRLLHTEYFEVGTCQEGR